MSIHVRIILKQSLSFKVSKCVLDSTGSGYSKGRGEALAVSENATNFSKKKRTPFSGPSTLR
jgi:hypothetical protein